MRGALAAFILCLIAPHCLAQNKVRLEFSSPGERLVWSANGYLQGPPDDADRVDAKTYDYSAGQGERLFIWDKTTGNLAARPLKDLKGSWTVKAADYDRIAQVRLVVNHNGKAVSAAHLNVRSKGYKAEEVLDPSSKGEVTLWAVPPGTLDVEAAYRTLNGKTGRTAVSFKLPIDRDEAVPALPVTVLADVETVSAASDSSKPQQPIEKREEAGGSFFGTLLTYVLAIAFAVGAGYLLLHVLRSKESVVKDKLQSWGVQVPDQQADDAAAPLPPMPVAPQPPEKIILDDAAPTPLTGTAAVQPPAIVPLQSATPRLIGESGVVYEIEDGLSTVGREDGVPISLAGESTVSRQHAEIVNTAGVVTLTDLGSTNGTYVNGRKVESEVSLKQGDLVQFGAVKFKFEGGS